MSPTRFNDGLTIIKQMVPIGAIRFKWLPKPPALENCDGCYLFMKIWMLNNFLDIMKMWAHWYWYLFWLPWTRVPEQIASWDIGLDNIEQSIAYDIPQVLPARYDKPLYLYHKWMCVVSHFYILYCLNVKNERKCTPVTIFIFSRLVIKSDKW